MTQVAREQAAVAIEGGGVELRTAEVGDMTVAFASVPKGTDFAPALRGLPDDSCPCPHWGYMLKGRLRVRTPAGDEAVYEAGSAFYWAPGHAPVALEDSEWIDFSPTESFNEVIAHIQANG